jgi:hypothetical protein
MQSVLKDRKQWQSKNTEHFFAVLISLWGSEDSSSLTILFFCFHFSLGK